MNLKKTLSPAVMFPRIDASTKEDAIRDMVTRLAAVHGIDEVEPLLTAVLEREQKDSTGLERGIAVPHGKTDAVNRLLAGIGRLAEPIEYGTRDGSPVRLLVMTVSPLARTGPHLQFIGEVVRLLRDENQRNALIEATDAVAMYGVMIR
ncbi:MAG: PTS sugar transporter subunit IIA [Alkalispirochaeta sp.]